MASLKFKNAEAFFDFIPMLLQLGTANPELLPDDDTANFFLRADKKMRVELRKFFMAHPEMRQQVKRFAKGVETGEQIVISIKADKKKPKQKYLKENYKTINETVKKHLGEKLNG